MSTVVVGLMYVLGAVAVGLVVPGDVLAGNFSNGIFDVFQIIGSHFGIPKGIMVRLVGIILLLGSLGALALWTAAPVKVFFSEIPEGVFGKWLVKTNDEGNPTNALIVQGFVVTVLLVIPALGIGNIDSFLEMLIAVPYPIGIFKIREQITPPKKEPIIIPIGIIKIFR